MSIATAAETALVITRGLPSSGKTTFAREWVANGTGFGKARARVNRDDLRHNLFGVYWGLSYEQEQQVSAAQKSAVRALLQSGVSVIVDDTNLRAKHATAWADMAEELGVLFRLVDMNVDVEQAVQWDKARQERGERHVGEDVIRRFAQRYRGPLPEIQPRPAAAPQYVPNEYLDACWLVDIDGTLALMGDRGPYEWHRVGEDTVHKAVENLVWSISDSGFAIVLLSGRDEVCRPQTEKWLAEHGIPYDELLMRREHDRRKDAIVKQEIFWRDVAPRWNVLGVLDDRNQVVQMWRAMGLFCAQVAPGDF